MGSILLAVNTRIHPQPLEVYNCPSDSAWPCVSPASCHRWLALVSPAVTHAANAFIKRFLGESHKFGHSVTAHNRRGVCMHPRHALIHPPRQKQKTADPLARRTPKQTSMHWIFCPPCPRLAPRSTLVWTMVSRSTAV